MYSALIPHSASLKGSCLPPGGTCLDVACDFTVVYDWLFQPWHIFAIMELKTRRIVHSAITTSGAAYIGSW